MGRPRFAHALVIVIVIACDGEVTWNAQGVGAGGTSGTAVTSSAVGAGGSAAGVPHPDNDPRCLGELPKAALECRTPGLSCLYSSDCRPDGCQAHCVGYEWWVSCYPCDEAFPDCPLEPPEHLSKCSVPTDSWDCAYNHCDDNAFAWASCDGAEWHVSHMLCRESGCGYVDKVPMPCPVQSACVKASAPIECTPHPEWTCPSNP